jgi:hypothetical protein
MYYEAVSVKYLHDYLLEVVFIDGTKGTVDLSDYATRGGVFSPFADLAFFKNVFINPEFGVLSWPGDLDIAPETIYAKAIGKPLQRAI